MPGPGSAGFTQGVGNSLAQGLGLGMRLKEREEERESNEAAAQLRELQLQLEVIKEERAQLQSNREAWKNAFEFTQMPLSRRKTMADEYVTSVFGVEKGSPRHKTLKDMFLAEDPEQIQFIRSAAIQLGIKGIDPSMAQSMDIKDLVSMSNAITSRGQLGVSQGNLDLGRQELKERSRQFEKTESRLTREQNLEEDQRQFDRTIDAEKFKSSQRKDLTEALQSQQKFKEEKMGQTQGERGIHYRLQLRRVIESGEAQNIRLPGGDIMKMSPQMAKDELEFLKSSASRGGSGLERLAELFKNNNAE